jgi:hypothetical protein
MRGRSRLGNYLLANRIGVGRDLGGRERQSGQRPNRLRPCFLHDRGAMVLNGALAKMEIRGDILAGVPGKHQRHDLVLTRREPRDMICRILSPGG